MNKEKKNPNKCPICGRPTHKESQHCIFHASAEEKTEEDFKMALKEYIQEIKEENRDYNFISFIFVGDINFKKDLNVTIFKKASFHEATFKGKAVFETATFVVYGDFREATFEGYAYFGKAIFMGYADFRMATFKNHASFKEATFKEDAQFWKVTFKGKAGFSEATFGYADFKEATIAGYGSFETATFGYADFSEATFGFVGFEKVTFKENAYFRKTTIAGYGSFEEATFEGDAEFWNATFEAGSNFEEATFKGCANFSEATFEGDAEFKLKYFDNIIDFSEIRIFSGKKLFIKLNNEEGEISFERAYIENVYLDIDLGKNVLIDFNDSLLKNTKIKKDQIKNHILQEKKKEFSKAQEIYLLLKNNFHSIGQYEDESWAFTKERDMERISKSFCSFLSKYKKYSRFKKILKQSNLLKRIIVRLKIFSKWLFSKKAIKCFNLSVSDYIFQYGENPWRVIRFALIIIFLFATILNFSGIVISDRTNLIIEFIKESQGDEYTLKYLGPILGGFLNCLYFSVVTFTTLGYGDFQPAVGLSRFFVSLESIIGAITMALFVYTFARRTGGR